MQNEPKNALTFAERQFIELFLAMGMNPNQIAKKINRSHTGIRTEIRRGGGSLTYKAKIAQQVAEEANNNRYNHLRHRLKQHEIDFIRNEIQCQKNNKIQSPSSNVGALEERISNLEQQLEIILDILGKKHDL
jgi:IS30 family transposase